MRGAKTGAGKNARNNNNQSTNNLFDSLKTDQMLSGAQKVITSAVNILEEEIAAGILAAKKMEQKIIDVEEIREDPADLMNRIRRDVHEAVDILMDSVTAISRQLGGLSESITKNSDIKKRTASDSAAQAASSVGVIKNIHPVSPGETVTLQLSVCNENIKDSTEILFRKSDLTGSGQNTINARNIKLQPLAVTLLPGEEKELNVHIKIPRSAAPGVYRGLFTDVNNPVNSVVIQIEVSK